jgi:hypothetical protein
MVDAQGVGGVRATCGNRRSITGEVPNWHYSLSSVLKQNAVQPNRHSKVAAAAHEVRWGQPSANMRRRTSHRNGALTNGKLCSPLPSFILICRGEGGGVTRGRSNARGALPGSTCMVTHLVLATDGVGVFAGECERVARPRRAALVSERQGGVRCEV